MNIFLSIFFSILMFFGSGDLREQALSAKYQDGSWSGCATGIPIAYVDNGLLYVDGHLANYPADSSVSYSVQSIVTTNQGTWFLDKNQTGSICILRLDHRGSNIKTWDFSEITWGSNKIETFVDYDAEEIQLIITYPDGSRKGRVIYYITFDPANQANA